MLNSLARLILALVALAVPFCANATLIAKSNFVTDTQTGLDWLDFSETNGRSVSFVQSQFVTGGLYEGWRFAHLDDVIGLFNSAGGSGGYSYIKDYPVSNIGVAPKLLTLLGSTAGADGVYRAASVHFEGNVAPDLAGFQIREWFPDSQYNFVRIADVAFATAGSEVGKAHALVRTSAVEVPEPNSIALFAVGMVGLGSLLRKRRDLGAGEIHERDLDHQAMKLTPLNLERIRATPQGGGRQDWPPSLWLNCHRGHTGHSDVYGRLAWDKPAAGLTTDV